MEELMNLIVGISVLILGFPLGNFLARATSEELKEGQIYFKILILVCLIVGFIGLIIRNDFLLFGFFFIAIVTSRSLVRGKKNAKS